MEGNTVQLHENSGGLIKTITNGAVSAQLSQDESRVLVVMADGTVQLWDSRGNHLQDLICGRATGARFAGNRILVDLAAGPTEVRDERGNLLSTIYK